VREEARERQRRRAEDEAANKERKREVEREKAEADAALASIIDALGDTKAEIDVLELRYNALRTSLLALVQSGEHAGLDWRVIIETKTSREKLKQRATIAHFGADELRALGLFGRSKPTTFVKLRTNCDDA
jgi:hypothetical protein